MAAQAHIDAETDNAASHYDMITGAGWGGSNIDQAYSPAAASANAADAAQQVDLANQSLSGPLVGAGIGKAVSAVLKAVWSVFKGGPGSGAQPGHPFNGNQWHGTSKIMDAVKSNGGATIAINGNEPKDGYIVATDPKLGQVVTGETFRDPEACQKLLTDYIVKNQAALASGSKYLGLWHNTDGGADEVHIDVVEKFDDQATAIQAGQDRNQISIWDVANGAEIPTGGTGSGLAT